jgi:ligand-binding sensor domain-containing protein
MPRYSPSFFVGRTLFHCDDVVDSVSFSAADGSETFYNATAIRAGTAPAFKVPGAVTMMTTDEKNNVWVGTDQNFLYCWNGTALTQYSIGGPTFNYFNRVYASKNGIVWMLPQAQDTKFNPPWWEGITSFNGKQWHLFNRFSVKGMGLFGDGGPDFRGICEDRNGNMWFGTSGTSVKMYNGSKNLWSYFYFAGYEVDSVRQDPQGGHFGKHDAIVQDSSGYLWVANHIMTTKIINGCLICYDPSRSNSPDYRRFFPLNSTYSFGDLRSLCVDSRGKILVGGGNDGRLLVLSHDGHPLQNGVNVVVDKSDMGTISGMCATSNGNTWIAAGSGLYNYTSGADSISLSLKTPVNCVAAETDSIIWLGTFGSGLIRYDVGKDSTKTVDIVSGLASNSINDISIDKTNGYLWVATAAGLSRYSLGHSSTPIVGNAEIIAFPNPFSLSNPNHREIVFKHCAAGAKVLIYAFNGALVKQLAPGIDNAYSSGENPFETTLHWVPSKKMSPGTYYFIGQSQKPTKTKKLLIVP